MQIIYNKLLKGGSAPKLKQKIRLPHHIPQMQKLTTKQKFMAFGASAKKTGNKYIVNPIKSTYKTVKTVVVAPLKYTEQLARVAVSLPGMAGKKVYRKIQKWGLKSNLASSEKKIANYESSGQPVNKNLMANYVKHKAKVDLINAKLKLRKARIKNNHTLFINRLNPMHSIKSIYNGSKYTNTTMKRDDSVLGALLGRSARTSSNNLTKKHYGDMTAVEKAKFDVLKSKSNLNATLVNKIYSGILPGEKHTVSEILDDPSLINTYGLALEKKRNDNTMTLDDTKLYNILRRKLLLNSQAEVKQTLKPKNTAQIQATPRTRESIANASHAIIQTQYKKIQANQKIKANADAAATAAAINKQKQEDAAAAAQKQLELQQETESDEQRVLNVSAEQQRQKIFNIKKNLHTSTDVNNVSLTPQLNKPVLIPAPVPAPAPAPAQITKHNRSKEQQILRYNLDAEPQKNITYGQEFNEYKKSNHYTKIPLQVLSNTQLTHSLGSSTPEAAATHSSPATETEKHKTSYRLFGQKSQQNLEREKKKLTLKLSNTKQQIIKQKAANNIKRAQLANDRDALLTKIEKNTHTASTEKFTNYFKFDQHRTEMTKDKRKLQKINKKLTKYSTTSPAAATTSESSAITPVVAAKVVTTPVDKTLEDDKTVEALKPEDENLYAEVLPRDYGYINSDDIQGFVGPAHRSPLNIDNTITHITQINKLNNKGHSDPDKIQKQIDAKRGELKTKPAIPARPTTLSKWKGNSFVASQLTKKNAQLEAPTRQQTKEQLEKQQIAQQKAITNKAMRNGILAEQKTKLANQKNLNNKTANEYSKKVKNAANKANAEKKAAKTQQETQQAGTEAQPYQSRWPSTTTQGQQTLSAAAAAKVVAAPVVVPPRRPPPPSEAALASITAEDAKITAEAANVVAAKVVAPTRPPPPSITAEAAKVVAAEEPLAEAAQHTTTTTAPPPSVEASSPSVEASSKPAHNTAAAEAAHNTAAAEAAEAKVVAAEASVEATPENTSTINEQKLKNSIEDTNRVNELQKHENNIAGHTERIKDLNIQQQIIDEMLADKNPQYKATPEINYEIFKKKLNNLQLSPEKKQDYLNDFTNKLRGKHSRSEMSEYIKGELHFHDTRMQSLQEKILSLAPAAQLKAKAEKLAKNTKNINTAKHMAAQALEQVQQNKNTNSLRSPLLQIFRKMKKLNQNLPTKDQLTTTGAISNAAYKAAANANLLTLEEQIRHAEKQSLPINTDTLTKQQNNNTVAGHTAHNAQYAKHVPEAAQHTATTPEVATAATNTKKEANAAKNNASDGVNKNFKGKMLWTSNGTKKTKKIGKRTTFYV